MCQLEAKLQAGLTRVQDRAGREAGPPFAIYIHSFIYSFIYLVSSEVGPEGQETAEITDFQRVRFCKVVVAAAPPPGAAR